MIIEYEVDDLVLLKNHNYQLFRVMETMIDGAELCSIRTGETVHAKWADILAARSELEGPRTIVTPGALSIKLADVKMRALLLDDLSGELILLEDPWIIRSHMAEGGYTDVTDQEEYEERYFDEVMMGGGL